MSDESSTTSKLLKEYLDCLASEKRIDSELLYAKNNLRNAINKLGEHLIPKDYQKDEKFSIWVNTKDGDRLLTIYPQNNTYTILWRK